MNRTLNRSLVVLVLVSAISGCCSPANLFSWIDRNCFIADWTNHYSCVSCCNCQHGSCQRPPQPVLPMLKLGNPPAEELEEEQFSTASGPVSSAFDFK